VAVFRRKREKRGTARVQIHPGRGLRLEKTPGGGGGQQRKAEKEEQTRGGFNEKTATKVWRKGWRKGRGRTDA